MIGSFGRFIGVLVLLLPILAVSAQSAGRSDWQACEAPLESHFCTDDEVGKWVLFAADTPIDPPAASPKASPQNGFDTPFVASILSQLDTSRPFSAGNYTANGQFTINVANGSCVGTYTVGAVPVAGSGPNGSSPPSTTVVMYIGFGQGNFLFSNAGAGQYTVTVTQTNPACSFDDGVNPTQLTVTINEGPNDTPFVVTSTQTPTSLPFNDPAYIANGSFTMNVANGSCAGTYTVGAVPVAGSGPNGSNPPSTTVVTYIGFGQGNFSFANAGIGQYTVTVTQTNPACGFEAGVNPFSTQVSVVQAEPQLQISPTSVDFGLVVVGVDSDDVTVTLASTGTSSLFVFSIAEPAAPFAIVGGNCPEAPFSLPAGDACTLILRYSPESMGAANAVVSVASTAASSPDSFSLTGTGLSPLPVPVASRTGLALLMLMLMLLAGRQFRRTG